MPCQEAQALVVPLTKHHGISVALDPSAWVDRYGRYLWNYAYSRLEDAAQAEDVVQETFAVAIEAAGSYAGRCSERTWLTAILKHKISDRHREHQKRIHLSGSEHGAPWDLPDRLGKWASGGEEPIDPEMIAQKAEVEQQLERCLKGLPSRGAEAVALRYLRDLSTQETCNVLGVSPTNLRVILHRARSRLRRCLHNWFAKVR